MVCLIRWIEIVDSRVWFSWYRTLQKAMISTKEKAKLKRVQVLIY